MQGGPCSAPTHFILRRLQTVHALDGVSESGRERERRDLEPRVGFGLDSTSSSVRGFFAGLWSAGGVASSSEAWEEGEE